MKNGYNRSDNVTKKRGGNVMEKIFFTRSDIFRLKFTAMATYIVMLLYVRKNTNYDMNMHT
jgi:hypothetical protein